MINVLCSFLLIAIPAQAGEPKPAVGPGSVIVHSKFGGRIFGFDIDPNSNEGVLCESMGLPDGNYLDAVETFNQTTGKIISVLTVKKSQDDFITKGVFNSVGLIEYEQVVGFLDVVRTFLTIV